MGSLKYLLCCLRDKIISPSCRKVLVFKTDHRKQKWRTQAYDSVCPGNSACISGQSQRTKRGGGGSIFSLVSSNENQKMVVMGSSGNL